MCCQRDSIQFEDEMANAIGQLTKAYVDYIMVSLGLRVHLGVKKGA